MAIKTKKTRKAKKLRGTTTHGHGARKKWKKSGHKGGVGMAGSGKRGDQKKTLVIKKYGNKYFGKQGITSKKTERRKNKIINLKDIEKNYDSLMSKFGKSGVLDLSEYKLLGSGELSKKVKLKVREASPGAVKGVEKVGGSVEVLKKVDNKQDENINNSERDKDGESESVSEDSKIKGEKSSQEAQKLEDTDNKNINNNEKREGSEVSESKSSEKDSEVNSEELNPDQK